ncbi:putative methyltransferase tdiE, partial [Colletotrichum sp. SAR11_240]
VPQNCKFEIDDVESAWYMDAPFDFIHVRYMACSLRDWPTFVERVYDVLGWTEEAVQELLDEVRHELEKKTYHAYLN